MDDPRLPTGVDPFMPLRLTVRTDGPSVNLARPDVLVGRHSEADVRLHLPDVSRRHCRLIFRDGSWGIYDLQSMNGVFVNDRRVEQAALRDGDRVRIGGYTFDVRIPPTAGPQGCAGTAETFPSDGGLPRRQAS
jgi:pSer/pThr/pTyr-binding forkhead associated (FHA) protein